jgi:hypothetical protein
VAAERWPQVENEAPPFTVRVRPDVTAVIRACLAHDPAARPQPQELAESLEAALTDLPKGKLSFKVR